jgi:hypothetical protein
MEGRRKRRRNEMEGGRNGTEGGRNGIEGGRNGIEGGMEGGMGWREEEEEWDGGREEKRVAVGRKGREDGRKGMWEGGKGWREVRRESGTQTNSLLDSCGKSDSQAVSEAISVRVCVCLCMCVRCGVCSYCKNLRATSGKGRSLLSRTCVSRLFLTNSLSHASSITHSLLPHKLTFAY